MYTPKKSVRAHVLFSNKCNVSLYDARVVAARGTLLLESFARSIQVLAAVRVPPLLRLDRGVFVPSTISRRISHSLPPLYSLSLSMPYPARPRVPMGRERRNYKGYSSLSLCVFNALHVPRNWGLGCSTVAAQLWEKERRHDERVLWCVNPRAPTASRSSEQKSNVPPQ